MPICYQWYESDDQNIARVKLCNIFEPKKLIKNTSHRSKFFSILSSQKIHDAPDGFPLGIIYYQIGISKWRSGESFLYFFCEFFPVIYVMELSELAFSCHAIY